MFSAQLTNTEAHLVMLEAGLRGLMEHGFDHNIRRHLMFENESTGRMLALVDFLIIMRKIFWFVILSH